MNFELPLTKQVQMLWEDHADDTYFQDKDYNSYDALFVPTLMTFSRYTS